MCFDLVPFSFIIFQIFALIPLVLIAAVEVVAAELIVLALALVAAVVVVVVVEVAIIVSLVVIQVETVAVGYKYFLLVSSTSSTTSPVSFNFTDYNCSCIQTVCCDSPPTKKIL